VVTRCSISGVVKAGVLPNHRHHGNATFPEKYPLGIDQIAAKPRNRISAAAT